MRYEDIIENYTPEMQLIDALDYLRDRPWLSAEILDLLASDSNNEKTDASLPQKDPSREVFSQDIQLLSTDWEPQYKSQGDSISISSPDIDEEQEWEYPYPPQNRYQAQHDVYLSSDHPLTAKYD